MGFPLRRQPTRTGEPARARTAYFAMPLRFEPDRRPGNDGATFVARGTGYAIAVSARGATIVLRQSADRAATIGMRLVGSSRRSTAG